MNGTSYKTLQILLGLIGLFHLVVGLGLNLIPGFVGVMANWYGANVETTVPFVYILKPLGVFMVALGVLGVAAARAPLACPMIPYAFAVVFFGWALQRIVFQGEIQTAFGIASGRNLGNAVFFFALGIVLLWLHRSVSKSAAAGSSAAA